MSLDRTSLYSSDTIQKVAAYWRSPLEQPLGEGESIEIETRYRPGEAAAAVYFERLLARMREMKFHETFERSTDTLFAGDDNVRKRVIQSKEGLREVWVIKERMEEELPSGALRPLVFKPKDYHDTILVISSEFIVAPITPTPKVIGTREKARWSFTLLPEVVRLDLTKVLTDNFNYKYEMELEFLAPPSWDPKPLGTYFGYVTQVYKWIYDTQILYTLSEKEGMIRRANAILGSGAKNQDIDTSKVVKARNLRMSDMVWGGIIGGKTGYTVAYKVDGQRKLLIFDQLGIWLVYPPYEYNLIVFYTTGPASIPGTILDGELVPVSKRKDPKITATYWYIPFDAISYGNKGSIVLKPHNERLLISRPVVEAFSNPSGLLYITNKSFLSVGNRDLFFQRTRELLLSAKTQAFTEDGLVFTPNNAPYVPPIMGKLLGERSLVTVPEVCKWKPPEKLTIDFRIKWEAIPGGQKRIILQSASGRGQEGTTFENFKGDKLYPYNGEVDSNHPLTKDLETGAIVEYQWVWKTKTTTTTTQPAEGQFVPLVLRGDKLFPNSLAQAIDNWNLLNNPITRADMMGETLTLMFKYHNRIKKDLYSTLIEGSKILDIGFGAGGDLTKYPPNSKVLGIDPNPNNLREGERRIKLLKMEDRVRLIQGDGSDVENVSKEVQAYFGGQVDAVTLMFSLTFFWGSQATLDSLVRVITTALKPEGQILFITLDGDAVEEYFHPLLLPRASKTLSLSFGVPEFEAATITYDYEQKVAPGNGKSLEVSISGSKTVPSKQSEYLVHIMDLVTRLNNYGYNLTKPILRADECSFLTQGGEDFSRLYCYGSLLGTKFAGILPSKVVAPKEQARPTEIKPTPPIPPKEAIQSEPTIPPKIPEPAISTEPPKSRVDSTGRRISLLSVIPPSSGRGPATGDDVAAPLPCTWYPPVRGDPKLLEDRVMRIAAIGDGNCFIHAFLKCLYPAYQNNGDYEFRVSMAKRVRRDLALLLGQEDPLLAELHPEHHHTRWEVLNNGQFVSLLVQEILSPELLEGADALPDCSLTGLRALFNSSAYLGDTVYKFIAQTFNVDLYVLIGTLDDCYIGLSTYDPTETRRPTVCIVGNTTHYEVVAVSRQGLFQTVFNDEDPFVQGLRALGSSPPRDPKPDSVNEVDQVTLNNILTASNFKGIKALREGIKRLPPGEPLIAIVQRFTEEGYLEA